MFVPPVSNAPPAVARRTLFGIEREELYRLLALYVIAHCGLLLIPNALYWDDWILYGVSDADILNTFRTLGMMFNLVGHLHVAMLTVGPWAYRTLTFALLFLAGVCLWKILERHDSISPESRYWIVALFLLLPFYNARVALIHLPYTLGYFLFFLGWALLGRNRLAALACLFLSFNVNSLLVFYCLPIAEWYLRTGPGRDMREALKWALRRLDFIAAPFVFWAIKVAYFRPHGLYAGYNETFEVRHMIEAPLYMARDLLQLDANVVLLAVALAASWAFVLRAPLDLRIDRRRLWTAGALATACALLPYWLVGAIPTFHEWSSRHQLLMPLGFALLLVCFVQGIGMRMRHAGLSAVIAISIAINVQAYLEFFLDWNKQKELVSLMAGEEGIRRSRLVVFDDRTSNARHRIFRSYEWNGLMKAAYGEEIRFGLRASELRSYLQGAYTPFFQGRYNAKDHVHARLRDAVTVTIDRTVSPNLRARIARIATGQPNYTLTVTPGVPRALRKDLLDSAL